jgi:hypothetical protein
MELPSNRTGLYWTRYMLYYIVLACLLASGNVQLILLFTLIIELLVEPLIGICHMNYGLIDMFQISHISMSSDQKHMYIFQKTSKKSSI